MGLIADISKAAIAAIKLVKETAAKKEKEKNRMEKILIQFRKELYDNRGITSGLLDGGKLPELKANDPALAKNLARIKTAAMKEVSGKPRIYKSKPSKKIAAFLDLLSITIHKIDQLKGFSVMNDGELALHPKVRLAVRVKNINQCLVKLIEEAG